MCRHEGGVRREARGLSQHLLALFAMGRMSHQAPGTRHLVIVHHQHVAMRTLEVSDGLWGTRMPQRWLRGGLTHLCGKQTPK